MASFSGKENIMARFLLFSYSEQMRASIDKRGNSILSWMECWDDKHLTLILLANCYFTTK